MPPAKSETLSMVITPALTVAPGSFTVPVLPLLSSKEILSIETRSSSAGKVSIKTASNAVLSRLGLLPLENSTLKVMLSSSSAAKGVPDVVTPPSTLLVGVITGSTILVKISLEVARDVLPLRTSKLLVILFPRLLRLLLLSLLLSIRALNSITTNSVSLSLSLFVTSPSLKKTSVPVPKVSSSIVLLALTSVSPKATKVSASLAVVPKFPVPGVVPTLPREELSPVASVPSPVEETKATWAVPSFKNV